MKSVKERIQMVADKWAYKYLTTAMTKEDIKEFHWDVNLGNLNYMDVMDTLQDYEVEWLNGRWIISRALEGEEI